MVHGEIYADEYGWDTTVEQLAARYVGAFAERNAPAREAGWIAELGGERVGCVYCLSGPDATTAFLRMLLVRPGARGHRLGARLVDTCVAFAREAGYARLRLWTVDVLAPARKLYLSRGFELVAAEPQRTFGVDAVAHTYELDLARVALRGPRADRAGVT
jgi:GNAT superfamily N-acetyltransferase